MGFAVIFSLLSIPLATVVYGAFVVWLTIQRIRTGTNTLIITLFQLFVLGIMPLSFFVLWGVVFIAALRFGV